jgi:predicted nucleic acid-binding protein
MFIGPVIIDSCAFIGLLRNGLDPAQVLLTHFDPTDLHTCGMIRVEVLRGVRVEKVAKRLGEFMDVMCNVPADNRLWNEAAVLGRKLGAMGVTMHGPDLIISTCAMHAGATVVTHDADFTRVPGLRVISPPWMGPTPR